MSSDRSTTSGEGQGRDGGASSSGRDQARAAALSELRRRPKATSWRRDAMGTTLMVLGATLAILAAGAWFSIVEMDRLRGHLVTLLLLFAVQALGVFAAIAPGKAMLRATAAMLAVAAAIVIVAERGAGAATATPAFACSTSHLAVDLIPLAMVLYALRRFSVTLGRSLLAGAAAAVTGAVAGELSCGRGWSHVLIHHVGAALVVTVGCVLLARLRQPQSFAP